MLSDYPEQAVAIMSQAFDMAALSSARRRKTGSCVVRQLSGNYFQPVSSGYNGTRPGHPNVCEDIHGISLGREVVHAEQNCAIKMMTQGVSTEGCIVVTTFIPCSNCCELLIDAKIREVLYCETSQSHDKMESVNKLQNAGISVCQVSKESVIAWKEKQLEGLNQEKFLGKDLNQEYQYFLDQTKNLNFKQMSKIVHTIISVYTERASSFEILDGTVEDWITKSKNIRTVKDFRSWFVPVWRSLRIVEDRYKKENGIDLDIESMQILWDIYCLGK